MPTYLCHGFRWQRRSIIVYVVVQNLDEAAPHWIIKRGSARNLIESFYNLFDFLPPCTLPPSTTASSCCSRAVSYSTIASARQTSTDDDNVSHHTSRSSGSLSRSRSRSRSTATPLQYQRPQTFEAPQPSGTAQNSTTPTAPRRPSSNSSRKRSEVSVNGLSSSRGTSFAFQPPSVHQAAAAVDFAANSDPVLAQGWSPVKLLEEYDPANLEEVSRPHAYVADYVTRISDSCSIVEEIQRYESRVRHDPYPPVTGPSSDEMLNKKRDTSKLGKNAGWLEQLRDELQQNEEIRWYVVVNGDEERAWPTEEMSMRQSITSRASVVQHQQYRQQLANEGQDRDVEGQREQLRKELGYEQRGLGKGRDSRPEIRLDQRRESRPKPPTKDLTPIQIQPLAVAGPSAPKNLTPSGSGNSTVISSPKSPKSPRTPGKGTFRRLFKRGQVEDGPLT